MTESRIEIVGWLNLFNTELSPKRWWWVVGGVGGRSQDVKEEGGTVPKDALPPPKSLLHYDGQR